MNKRIVTSLFVIALAAALVGGATMAWFTDSAKVEGNSFTAGTLDIEVEGDAFNVGNMAPGDTETTYIYVKNAGSLDMLFKAELDNEVDGGLKSALNVKVTGRPAEIQSVDGYNLYGPAVEYVLFDGSLSNFTGLDNLAAWINNDDPLWPGYAAVFKIEVTLPTTAGNEYQGKSYSADLKFSATQAKNQDPDNVKWDN